jgi:hypothetical protein
MAQKYTAMLADVLTGEPNLHLNLESSRYGIWADWDGQGTVGYWVASYVRADGSGFARVSWIDGSDDNRRGPDPQISLLDITVPAKAVGDGKVLALLVLNTLRADREDEWQRREVRECTCVECCDEDPRTACSLSGIPHVHPDDGSGTFGPCPVHPDRPGDH